MVNNMPLMGLRQHTNIWESHNPHQSWIRHTDRAITNLKNNCYMEHATENVNSDMFAYCERTLDWVYICSPEARTHKSSNIQNKMWPSENRMCFTQNALSD